LFFLNTEKHKNSFTARFTRDTENAEEKEHFV